MDAPVARRSSNRSERNKRYRARQRAGAICVNVEINASVIDFLCATHWLTETDAADAAKIGVAIKLCLETAARAAL